MIFLNENNKLIIEDKLNNLNNRYHNKDEEIKKKYKTTKEADTVLSFLFKRKKRKSQKLEEQEAYLTRFYIKNEYDFIKKLYSKILISDIKLKKELEDNIIDENTYLVLDKLIREKEWFIKNIDNYDKYSMPGRFLMVDLEKVIENLNEGLIKIAPKEELSYENYQKIKNYNSFYEILSIAIKNKFDYQQYYQLASYFASFKNYMENFQNFQKQDEQRLAMDDKVVINNLAMKEASIYGKEENLLKRDELLLLDTYLLEYNKESLQAIRDKLLYQSKKNVDYPNDYLYGALVLNKVLSKQNKQKTL